MFLLFAWYLFERKDLCYYKRYGRQILHADFYKP